MRKLTSRFRLTMGLVLLFVSVFLSAIVLELLPDRLGAVRRGRAALAEASAIIVSDCVTRRAWPAMEQNLETLVSRNEELVSCAVRRTGGTSVVEIGDHRSWQPLSGQFSTDTQVKIPIYLSNQTWGHLELKFTPEAASGWAFLSGVPMQLLTFLAAACFLAFYWYLGRMLKQLDPSKAVPQRVRSALDTMAEGLMVLDDKGRIVLANEAFSDVVGGTPDDLIGVQVLSLGWKQEDGQPVVKESAPWQSSLSTGELVRDSIVHLEVSGQDQTRTFLCNCTPVLGNGNQHGGVLVSFDDITQLEKNKEELKEAKQEADAANQAKSQFLANMSHEIRTPMNAILGFTDVLRRGTKQDAAKQQKHLNTIHSSGTHLLSLINDILDLSKVEAGRLEVETIDCAIHRVIAEVVTVMRVNAEAKGISLNFEFDGEIPETIQSDPAKLRQVLTNLVGNAIKFTEQGGVVIVTKFKHGSEKSQMEIQVADSGIGMTPEQAAKIFDPFSQADSSVTRRFGGTGLGLAISKKFAEALGGGISVHSEPGVGSVFVITVDAGPVDSVNWIQPTEADLESMCEQEVSSFASLPSLSVLLVDDAEENRDLMAVIMEELGAQYEVAENGLQAVEMACSNAYDVILMDMNMPVMDGYTATSTLRDRGHQTPIIALTAHAMSEAGQQCLDAGCTGYLSKPVNLDELIRLLAEVAGVENIQQTQIPLAGPKSIETKPSDEPSVDNASPLTSSLDTSNPKFLAVVKKFVDRLPDQLELMIKAIEEQQFEEIQRLAHWMKGSGPNVGFAELAAPSRKLEEFAKDKDVEAASATLDEIRQLCSRIFAGFEPSEEATTGASAANPGTADTSEPGQTELQQPIIRQSQTVVSHVRSMDQFLSSLDQQVDLLQRALSTGDANTISQIGSLIAKSGRDYRLDQLAQIGSGLESVSSKSDVGGARQVLAELLKIQNQARGLYQSAPAEPAGQPSNA